MDCCESRPSGPIPSSVPTDPGEKVVFLETLLQESPFGEEGGWRRAVMPEDRLPR